MGCTYRYKLRSCLRGERKILEGETAFRWVYMHKFCPCGYHVEKESEDGRRLWQTCNLRPSALFSLFTGSFYPFFVVGSISASPSGEERWLITRTKACLRGRLEENVNLIFLAIVVVFQLIRIYLTGSVYDNHSSIAWFFPQHFLSWEQNGSQILHAEAQSSARSNAKRNCRPLLPWLPTQRRAANFFSSFPLVLGSSLRNKFSWC